MRLKALALGQWGYGGQRLCQGFEVAIVGFERFLEKTVGELARSVVAHRHLANSTYWPFQ